MPIAPVPIPAVLPVPSDRIDAFEMFMTARACGAYLPLVLDVRREPLGWMVTLSRVGDDEALEFPMPACSPVLGWIAGELARMVG